MRKIPQRYIPKSLTVKDRKKQMRMLNKSRKAYQRGEYYTREKLDSYTHKKSPHIRNAQSIYHIERILPNKELSIATGCSVEALQKIVQKGEGAYYSSGSRPNQTPQSWGIARLASAITSGKSATVDYHILEEGCNPKKKALILAKKSMKKYHKRV